MEEVVEFAAVRALAGELRRRALLGEFSVVYDTGLEQTEHGLDVREDGATWRHAGDAYEFEATGGLREELAAAYAAAAAVREAHDGAFELRAYRGGALALTAAARLWWNVTLGVAWGWATWRSEQGETKREGSFAMLM